ARGVAGVVRSELGTGAADGVAVGAGA
ncbi:MAG: hypothetical protein RLZZ353_1468, partial [Actinomycetota bacterium]